MIYLIIKGLLIGFLISIPVGPIAVLCIQRTLNRGKYHGLVTGLGAATSDLVYAILGAFGFSFVINLIEKNQFAIELIGAGIILLFGIYLFNTNPVKNLTTANGKKKESYFQDFFTAFGLTITNPLIMLLFIALFARFSFIEVETSLWQLIVGFFFIFLGAALWWGFLTASVNLFRSKINLRGLHLINKITGILLMLLAIGGIILSIYKLNHDFPVIY